MRGCKFKANDSGAIDLARPSGYGEEIEFKLAVVGAEPSQTLDDLARLKKLDAWSLGAPIRHVIHDIYWDTANGALCRKAISLRLRDVDGEMLFTTKSGGTSHGGLFQRRELELPATRDNWDRLRSAFADAGVRLRPVRSVSTNPVDWLRGAGLVVTQDRATERRARAVREAARQIAEMALDSVIYRLGVYQVVFREVEIESRDGTPQAGRDIGRRLMSLFQGRLEPATMGKYGRGLMLERRILRDVP